MATGGDRACFALGRGTSGNSGQLVVKLMVLTKARMTLLENTRHWNTRPSDAQSSSSLVYTPTTSSAVSTKKSDFELFTAAANEEGILVQIASIDSQHCMIPQSRHRLYALASRMSGAPIDQNFPSFHAPRLCLQYERYVTDFHCDISQAFPVSDYLLDDHSAEICSWKEERLATQAKKVAEGNDRKDKLAIRLSLL